MQNDFLLYRDLGLKTANKLDNRPSLEDVTKTFRGAKYTAYFGATVLTLVLVIIWPAGMIAEGVFSLSQFKNWVSIN